MYNKDMSRESKVQIFHRAMGLDINSVPRVSLLELRKQLLLEEVGETVEVIDRITMKLMQGRSTTKQDWSDFLKELTDVQYIISGTFVSFNTFSSDFDTSFNRVHDSNMSKLDGEGNPVYNKDGKVLKGSNYKCPDLKDLIGVL
jgi:predicted HAD superfamily Cof-like phosphohydrolase